MKQTFLAKRNALLSPRSLSVGAVVFGVVIVLLIIRVLFPGFFLRLSDPLFSFGASMSDFTGGSMANFQSNAGLARSNQNLLSENAALSTENANLQAKIKDLEKLNGAATADVSGVVAGVMARPPETPYDTLVVRAGAADGIKAGDLVFGPGGIPLGTVGSVAGSYARISLYSTAGRLTDGWIGSAHTAFTLTGNGGGTFLGTVPRASTVVVGDKVMLAGPGALQVGTVARIDGDPAAPTLQVRVTPLANLFSLTWVRIEPAP